MGASESVVQREDGSSCNSVMATGTDPNCDADMSVINEILMDTSMECTPLQLTRLWLAVERVVRKFLHNDDVIANVTKACHSAASKFVPISSPSTTFPVVSSVLSALSSFSWKDHPSRGPILIELTGDLSVCFQRSFSSPELVSNLAAIYCKAFDTDTYGSLTQPAIACGRQFPLRLSISLLRQLDSDGVHRKLRMLVGCYDVMEKEELAGLLCALIKFLEACPSSSDQYVEESSHLLLLFAAQKFSMAMACQSLIWKIMMKLCENSPSFMSELDGATLLSAIFLILQAQAVQQNRSTLQVIQFLLLCCTKYPATIIPASLNCRELMTLILGILDVSNGVSENQEILLEIANFLALLCTHIKEQPTIELLMQYDIVGRLKEATEKWPTLCILPTCAAIDSVSSQFPPDLASLPFFVRGHFTVNSANEKLKQKFYSNNHVCFIKNLLENQLVTSEHRLAIYSTTVRLFKNGIPPTFVNKPFLETIFSKIFSDVDDLQHETRLLVITVHSVIHVINGKELAQAVLDLDLHTKVVNVLSTIKLKRELRSVTLNLVVVLIRLYHTYLQNITSFAITKLPSMIVLLAQQVGMRSSNDDNEATEYAGHFSRIVLSLTADKNLSDLLYSQGYMQELYSLVSSHYEPQITRSSIHAIGNVALNSHAIKQGILDDKFHEKLFTFLDQRMVDTDALTLGACCRVLRILGSGDSAKRMFAECGVVSVLLRLLHTRANVADLVWQSLGLIASIGFMALVNKCYVLTMPVLRTAHEILNSTGDAKVAGYTVLLSLAAVDLDINAVRLRELGFVRGVQKKIENDRLTRANPDLQRWAVTLLEKSALFTLSVSQDKEEELLSALKDSLTWPEVISGAPLPIDNDSVLITRIPLTLLPQDDERFLVAQHPSAPFLSETDKQQLSKLGLSPDQPLFRVGRLCGNNHTSCSNCESDDHSEELVFRPHGLTPHQYQCLIDNGWYRRGAVKMYRFRYNHSLNCSDWETRVILSEFNHRSRKSYRKVLKKVPDSMTIETIPTQFVRESFELYNEYHQHKHNKPSKSEFSYAQHTVNSPIRNETIDGIEYGTHHQLYRLDGKLVAVGLIDIVPNGVVSLYMWYSMSKEMQKLSLGVYSALKEIEFAQKLSERNPNIKYYYLQGWNGSNHKLSYKANYTPGDFYSPCTVTDWVCGLDGVKKAQEEAREKWRQAQEKDTATDQTDSVEIKTFINVFQSSPVVVRKAVKKNAVKKNVVPGDALSLDRVRRERLTGSSSVDVGSVVICLNHQRYLPFRELVENYQLEDKQRELLETRLEELVLAVGPELSSNMVIDMKACLSPSLSS